MSTLLETHDVFRGAYLLCAGGTLESTYVNRGQVIFVIKGDDIEQADWRYRTGDARVNPLQLRETLNLLRDRLFMRLRSEKERSVHHAKNPQRGYRTA